MAFLLVILQLLLLSASFIQANQDLCASGLRQSPIPLVSTTAQIDETQKDVQFMWEGNDELSSVMVKNTKASVSVTYQDSEVDIVIGDQDYELLFLDLHWGGDSSVGSEHSVDGSFFSGEMEFYFYNMEIDQSENTLGQPGGVAIVSVLLQEGGSSSEDKDFFKELLTVLPSVSTPSFTETTAKSKNLASLLPASTDFFRYPGSLSSSPCTENIDRIVLKTPISVSVEFMAALRSLKSDKDTKISNSYRAPQDLNDRPVFKSFL